MLLLEHPAIADLDCETECAKWIYEIPSGKLMTRGRSGKPQARQPHQPTPCHLCPKGSPAKAKTMQLTQRSAETVRLYLRSRATCGVILNDAERADDLLARNFATIDSVFRAWEAGQLGQQLSAALERLQER